MNQPHNKWISISVLVLISVYLFAAQFRIAYPGLQYDEVLFVNAATLGEDNSFIFRTIFGIPFLLMSYIGALKAYLYIPIFKFFSITSLSIRMPVILLTALTLLILFKAIKTASNNFIALSVLTLMCLNVSVISYTRTDVGPNAIELFLFAGTYYCIFNLAQSLHKKHLWFLLYTLLGLGLFNKLNFLWFINCVYPATALLLWNKEYIETQKKMCKALGIFFASYLPFLIYFLFQYYKSSIFSSESGFDIAKHFLRVKSNLFEIIGGHSFTNYALGNFHSTITNSFVTLLSLLIICGIVIAAIKKEYAYRKVFFFFMTISIFNLLQILATIRATAPWHVFTMLVPLFCLTSISLYYVTNLIRHSLIRSAIIILFFCFVVANSAQIYLYQVTQYANPKNIAWTPEINRLIDYVSSTKQDYLTVDWGIHNQLQTMDKSNNNYKELLWVLNEHQSQEELSAIFRHHFLNKNLHIITHPPGKWIKPNAERNLTNLLEMNHHRLAEITSFDNLSGEKKLIVYRYEPDAISTNNDP